MLAIKMISKLVFSHSSVEKHLTGYKVPCLDFIFLAVAIYEMWLKLCLCVSEWNYRSQDLRSKNITSNLNNVCLLLYIFLG